MLRSGTDRARPHDERARHRFHHQSYAQGRKGNDRSGSGRHDPSDEPLRQGHAGFRKGRRLCGTVRSDRNGGKLGLPQEVMGQQLGTLSGGQRRRIELARILFSDADTLILDEPTNHLDADSIEWLRGYLKKYEGGFLVISHSTELLDEVVNKVWHLDAQLGQIDMYSLGWKAYLHQRVVDEERRRREREVAEKKAERLMQQGIRLHAKATKAVAAQNMMRRAEKLLETTSEAQKQEKVADIRFPEPAPCGRTPIMAKDVSKAYGSNIVFAGVNLAIDKGSRVVILGYNGAGKTTTLRLLAHLEEPDTGSVDYGHGCKIGYFAQEHDTLDLNATVLENLIHVAPELNDTQARSILGSFLFSGDDALSRLGVLSGGEKTRLALATLVTSVRTCCCLTNRPNNLDPASRDEILKAIAKYEGAIVLVTHDEGAVQALNLNVCCSCPTATKTYGTIPIWNWSPKSKPSNSSFIRIVFMPDAKTSGFFFPHAFRARSVFPYLSCGLRTICDLQAAPTHESHLACPLRA